MSLWKTITDDTTTTTTVSQFASANSTNSTTLYSEAYSNLTSGLVKVGISDPNSDPAGFRAWINLEIAGFEYHNGNRSYFENRMIKRGGSVSAANAADLVSPLDAVKEIYAY